MYSPMEDSYLLSETLQKYLEKIKNKNISILDMGSGTGIQAETCRKAGFVNILAADIDKETVSFLKGKKFEAVESNLFSKINRKFDLIVFNPPYLPEHKYDHKKDTAGGKKGYETILKFLGEAKDHIKINGSIILLFSSLSSPGILNKKFKELRYNTNLLARKKLFFEELFVVELKTK